MNRLVIGVVGHVDHGKTALVRALTGVDTDRLAEEKRRGISIALGFAHFEHEGGTIDLIDMPGHERFVCTMVAGVTGIDAVLVVVAANEGVQPQTVEHVAIAGLLGLRRAVVAVSKCDLVGVDEARGVVAEVVALLARNGLSPAVPAPDGAASGPTSAVLTSARSGQGVNDLRRALCALAAQQTPPAATGLPFLPIDRAFVMTGHGPVVTGTLRGAGVRVGDTLDLLPAGKPVRVRAVQVHGRAATHADPGSRAALNLRGADIADLARGMALVQPGSIEPSPWLTLAIAATGDAPALRNGAHVKALFGTGEVEARLRLLDCDQLDPGARGFAQLHCAEPVALPTGEHVIARLATPTTTVAGGRLIDPLARRLRRNDPAVLRRLKDLRDLPVPALVAAEIERSCGGEATVARLARLGAVPPARIEELLGSLPVVVNRRGQILRRAELDPLLARLPAVVGALSLGLSRKQIAANLPGTRAVLVDEALAILAATGAIVRRGQQFMLPDPESDRALAASEAALARSLASTLRDAGLRPPQPSALVGDARARRAVDRLLRDGTVVRCVDAAKRRELLFHRAAIAEARRTLAPLLGGEGLLVTQIAAALSISRKFAMPLLAHLDATRFTRRSGDRRILHRPTDAMQVPTMIGERADREETAL